VVVPVPAPSTAKTKKDVAKKPVPKSLDDEGSSILDAQLSAKLSQKTVLEKIEHINDKHIRALLQCPFVDQTVKTKLRRLKKHKVGKNLYRTEYAYSANYDDRGGRWARGTSLQNIEARDHPYRQFLSCPKYHDIDQSNSAPTIIQHLLKKHSINCPEMDDYVSNRSTILEEKKLTKQNVMEMLTYAPRKIADPLFAAIHATIYNKLFSHLQADYPDIWKRVLASKNERTIRNREGTLLCVVVHTLENYITQCIDSFFTDRGWSVDVLVFDGCMIRRRDDEEMTLDLLDKCEEFILKETGVKMKLVEKSLEVPTTFLETYRLQLEKCDDEDAEEPPSKPEKTDKKTWEDIDYDALKKLKGWESFDFRRV
ncbi:hypothetical protein HK104_006294, partial [Borealophlyctis nickersoniae]